MKLLINLEELAKLFAAYVCSLYLGVSWWTFLVLLLTPDVSMLGYLINPKIGAWVYNLFHHQAIAILTGAIGFILGISTLQMAGLVLFGHSAMDRALGYGLKHTDGFKHTHLGWIGRS
ncbi:uncharacterized protein DUF4260 [Pontibacter ummariensis]|uniref:DUF4260 domain-containing protein n=1 Tax=Pontibacter ummariensis TaxID=1610492 RepID=A0A239L7G6_9BACT|nr:DUF4260 domain-containing protein [Pontibacter ummariensis]PRY04297.1 uncharacterized protein DUF4260 [Pontibacter ummariensis]SNT25942.1 protein of unknown function [Pontibacter ummariensis]